MRYLVGLFLTFFVVILAIILVVNIRKPDSNTTSTKKAASPVIVLPDYASTSATTQFTTYGRIVAEEERRAIRIIVGRDSREVQVLKGYQGIIEKRQTYTNNQAAYDVFLRALARAGFTLERKLANPNTDEVGSCASGFRYVYELTREGRQLLRRWTTSCSTAPGNFGGTPSLVKNLFTEQIPDYSKAISGTTL